jgi:hypothetical protein
MKGKYKDDLKNFDAWKSQPWELPPKVATSSCHSSLGSPSLLHSPLASLSLVSLAVMASLERHCTPSSFMALTLAGTRFPCSND